MEQERLTYLIGRYAAGTIAEPEKAELQALLQDLDHMPEPWLEEQLPAMEPDEADVQRRVSAILAADRPAMPVRTLNRWWWAAAAVLLLGSIMLFSVLNRPIRQQQVVVPQQDVAPGSEKAILTLADGTDITLDSTGAGAVAQQGNVSIVSQAGGQLTYQLNGMREGEMMMNTLRTPRGGQFQLTLPDGTKVWLNAASSITFPAAFNGRERKVQLKGEAYFEVAKNEKQPFVVDASGRATVEVLGTGFNVNAYEDEPAVRTTLLEGSVKIVHMRNKVVLKPGQQATVEADIQLSAANPDQVLAWKNGIFNFEDLGFAEVARQLERWYDIDVVYEGMIPDIKFKGDMDKGVNLSGILRLFSALGVKARIEGRKLIVM